uniref:hypothetical protein n=1 Tax=Amycolatopsis benzoatilytica TaxID=346045 RepID=UPI0037C5C900
MAKKSASELADELAGLGEEIVKRATAETRKYVAQEIEEQFLGTPRAARKTYCGRTPDDCIMDALTDDEAASLKDARLQAVRERFEEDGPSDDFRAGILFAVRLFADPTFDY